MALPTDYKNQVLSALQKKQINANCEVCGQNDWSIIDKAVTLNMSDLDGTFTMPGPMIPSAGTACNNCGNIRLFALAILGIELDKNEGEK